MCYRLLLLSLFGGKTYFKVQIFSTFQLSDTTHKFCTNVMFLTIFQTEFVVHSWTTSIQNFKSLDQYFITYHNQTKS
jgi:hypothetical protein